jgi:hypothetical protein
MTNLTRAKLLFATLLFLAVTNRDRAQDSVLGNLKNFHPTDFSSETYFEPPNETKVKIRLSGAQASPLPGGLLDVRQLKIAKFATNGVLEAEASAPQCTYAPLDGIANSPGKMEFHTGDGKFRVEGEGFLLRQTNWSLTISNHVHTVIDFPTSEPTAPLSKIAP